MTDKDIKGLFDKLNPDDIQKQKAWNNIKKAGSKKKVKPSYKKTLLIAAIISTTVVLSAFGINAISGGSLFKNIGKAILGDKTVAQAHAAVYTSETSAETTLSAEAVKINLPEENRKIKAITTNETTALKTDNPIITSEPPESEPTTPRIEVTTYEPTEKVTNPPTTPETKTVETSNPNEVIKGNYLYMPLSGTTASIVDYVGNIIGNETKITIPSEIDGYKIVCIDECAFTCNFNLTEVIIPEGITEIKTRAFWGCKNLTKVKLPDTLETIEARAFVSTALRSIDIPNSVTTIEKAAFANCRKLSDVKIGTGIKTIGENAFNNSDIISISGYIDTAAYEYALNNNIIFHSLGYVTEADDSEVTEPASQSLDENKIDVQRFCEVLNRYVNNIGAAERVGNFNPKNLSRLKIYKSTDGLIIFHIESNYIWKCSEIINGYKFTSNTLLSDGKNKCGYCVFYNDRIYSLKEAVDNNIIETDEAAKLIPTAKSIKDTLTNCIFFDAGEWGNTSNIYCHIWERNGDSFFKWKSQTEKCVSLGSGIYYYDLSVLNASTTLPNGLQEIKDYLIVFCSDDGKQTYDCTFGKPCIDDTLKMTGEIIENPIDFERETYEAVWINKNEDYGPHIAITSIGNITGTHLCPNETSTEIIGDWLLANYKYVYIDSVKALENTFSAFSINSENIDAIKKYIADNNEHEDLELMYEIIERAYSAYLKNQTESEPVTSGEEYTETEPKHQGISPKKTNPIEITSKSKAIKLKHYTKQ